VNLARYLAGVAVASILIAVAFVMLVGLFAGRGSFDAQHGEDTIFQNESITAVYTTPAIAAMAGSPEVVILGASNARRGFRPGQVSPLVGNIPVHNLGMGAQNIRSCCELIDLIYRQTPPARRRNLIFAFGIWYGLMVGNEKRWPDGMTSVDNELLRCQGLFRQTAHDGARFVHPDRFLSPALRSVWPLLVPRASYEQAWRYLFTHQVVHSLPADVRPPMDSPDGVLDEQIMGKDLLHITANHDAEMYGPVDELGDSGYQDLLAAARRIHAAGGQLVLLDLPLTSAGLETRACARYKVRMRGILEALAREGFVHYVDMKPYFNDSNFYDYIHPRPKVTADWARLAAGPIRAALGGLSGR
jgi:hypothetical protein